MKARIDGHAVALVVVRDGRLPAGAEEAVAEAGGRAVLVGSGSGPEAAGGLAGATRVWWAEAPLSPARLAASLAPVLEPARLVVLPASPDGRDLGPRLAAAMGRPLLAGAVRATVVNGRPEADLLRADGRVVVPVSCASPVVATLWPGARSPLPAGGPRPAVEALDLDAADREAVDREAVDRSAVDREAVDRSAVDREAVDREAVDREAVDRSAVDREAVDREVPAGGPGPAVESLGQVEPDPATMDLADAPRVVAGGAGLVPDGASDAQAAALFSLLSAVAAALGASAGATRVVTDAGWMGYDRQIGTTGVTLRPELYVALGISGASQHIGGIGDPARVLSVNLDASCPMTGLADLGVVADAPSLLVELAARLGVPVPAGIEEVIRR